MPKRSFGFDANGGLMVYGASQLPTNFAECSHRQLQGFPMLSLAHFRLQRRSLRSLIYLSWIYSFVSRAVGAFSQIYIFELFNSVQLAIIAGIAAFTGIMIGFCICGVVAAYYRLNAKHGFLLSFLFTGLGLILLPLANDVPGGLRRGGHKRDRKRPVLAHHSHL